LNHADFEELCEDIQKNGLLEPITLYQGEIIDGRHRYDACIKVGIEPRYFEYEGNDPVAYVISKNNIRRQLNDIDKAIAARKLANIKKGQNVRWIDKEGEDIPRGISSQNELFSPITVEDAAKTFDTSTNSIWRATPIVENGSDELFNAISEGKVKNITLAGEIAKLPKEEQAEIVAKGEKEILAKAKELKNAKIEEKIKKKQEEKQKIFENIKTVPPHERNPLMVDFDQAYQLGNSITKLKPLENDSIDLVLTDPPYGIDYNNNRREVSRLSTEQGISNDKDNLELLNEVAKEACRVLKPGRHLYWFGRADVIFPQIEMLKNSGFTVKNVLIWLKNNHGTGDLLYSYASRYEVCVYAIKDARKNSLWNKDQNRPLIEVDGISRHDDILEFSKVSSGDLIHDHQKPLELLHFLLSKSSYEGETVLDPFAGSGSTLIASLLAGRKAIGFEIDPTIRENSLKEWTVKYG
jgi:DNA modification methylase